MANLLMRVSSSSASSLVSVVLSVTSLSIKVELAMGLVSPTVSSRSLALFSKKLDRFSNSASLSSSA